MEIVVAGEPDLSAAGEIVLKQQRERLGGTLLAQLVTQIAIAAFRNRLRDPQRIVELGTERVGRVRRGADAKQREVLQGREYGERADPCAAVPGDERALVYHIGKPADLRHAKHPAAVLPCRKVIAVADPSAGRTGTCLHDPALPFGGGARGGAGREGGGRGVY